MKTILISLVVATIVALAAIKEDTAEALWMSFKLGCIIGFAIICAWITAKLRAKRVQRIREDNRLRRDRMIHRAKYIEVELKEAEKETIGF